MGPGYASEVRSVDITSKSSKARVDVNRSAKYLEIDYTGSLARDEVVYMQLARSDSWNKDWPWYPVRAWENGGKYASEIKIYFWQLGDQRYKPDGGYRVTIFRFGPERKYMAGWVSFKTDD